MTIEEEVKTIIASSDSIQKKVEALVALVTNIPYQRIGSLDPADMIAQGKGSCTPKHVFLAQCLHKLGIPVHFLVMSFFYKKLDIRFPEGHDVLIQSMPASYHVALKAQLSQRWTILDCTWDIQLKGFPGTKDWDGVSDMSLCVTPEKILERDDDPYAFKKGILVEYTPTEKKIRKEFYAFFDTVLEDARK